MTLTSKLSPYSQNYYRISNLERFLTRQAFWANKNVNSMNAVNRAVNAIAKHGAYLQYNENRNLAKIILIVSEGGFSKKRFASPKKRRTIRSPNKRRLHFGSPTKRRH